MKRYLIPLMLFLGTQTALSADDALVIIAHGGVAKVDAATLQRLYTGRMVSIGSVAASPVNLPVAAPLRQQFLEVVMGQTEDQYTGYWLVRRYVGKGVPPSELPSVDDVIAFVSATPGGLGYIPASKVPAGANVIFRK